MCLSRYTGFQLFAGLVLLYLANSLQSLCIGSMWRTIISLLDRSFGSLNKIQYIGEDSSPTGHTQFPELDKRPQPYLCMK